MGTCGRQDYEEVVTRYEVLPSAAGRLFTPAVAALITVHIAGFAIPVLSSDRTRQSLVSALGLVPAAVFARLRLWQLVTHSALYPAPCWAWCLVCTLSVLLFLGSRLEREWGTWRFALFYIAMATAAGLTRAIPEFGGPRVVVGSLGVVCAVLAAFGLAFRSERVWVFFSVVPAPHFVIGALVVVLLLNLKPVENVLWLSGAAFGLLYVAAVSRRDARRARLRPVTTDRFARIDLGE